MVIIVPTRSAGGTRVKTLDRLLESWSFYYNTADVVIAIDNDEKDIYPIETHENIQYVFVPRMSYCEKLNYVVKDYVDDYKVIGHLSDDHTFNTEFEKPIMHFVGKRSMGVCYGNDLLQGENLPTAPFISSNIIKGLGFMCPPGLKHMYVDNFWKDLGIRLDCLQYFPDIITEHMHWSAGKSVQDDQYKEVNDLMERDRTFFDAYRNHQMGIDIERVKKHIYG